MDQNDEKIPDAIDTIKSIYNRVSVSEDDETESSVLNVTHQKDYVIPEVLSSRLMQTQPRLKPVIGKFVGELSEKCKVIDLAVVRKDYQEIEQFGHWLKASGGSLGFNAFTEPARDLENHAKQRQVDSIKHTVSVIKQLNSRIQQVDKM